MYIKHPLNGIECIKHTGVKISKLLHIYKPSRKFEDNIKIYVYQRRHEGVFAI
jgi:hypothetical protein